MSQTKAQLIDPVDGTIVNADINASAAIAGTKISPNFGSQNIVTTGAVDAVGVTIGGNTPSLNFNDANDNPDFRFLVNSNSFILEDTTNTANRLVVNSSGNVGIGTSSPTSAGSYSKFVQISDNNSASIAISRSASGTAHTLELGAFSGASLIESTGATSLRFKTNSSERMRLDSSGNLLVGASSYGGGGSSPKFYISTTSDRAVKIHNTNTATSSLQITNAFSGQGDDNGIQIAMLANGDALIQNVESGSLRFSTSSTERMRIDNAGKIGIGTVSPSNIIHATGSNSSTGYQFINTHATDGFGVRIVGGGTTADRYALRVDDAAENERFRVNANGNVGIGTASPEATLHEKITTSKTNSIEHMLILEHLSSGTTTTGFGAGIRFRGERNNGVMQNIGDINLEADVNSGSNISCAMVFKPGVAGVVTEHMRLTSEGKLGIGISSSIDRPLHIVNNGGALVKMEANYSGSVTGIEGVLTAAGANRYVLGMYGKVVNTSNSESGVARIRFYNEQASPTTSDSPGYITFDTTNDGSGTPTEKVRITSAGFLGIGAAANTGAQIDIQGNSEYNTHIRLRSYQGGAVVEHWNGRGISDNSDTGRLGVGKNGNALIYTSASGSPITAFAIGNSDAKPLIFSTGNAEKVRVDGGSTPTLLIGQTTAGADANGWTLRGAIQTSSVRFTSTDVRTMFFMSSYHSTGSASTKFAFHSNGELQATNTTIQPFSSERRTKKNIVALNLEKAWNTLRDTPFYTFNFKDEIEGTRLHHGPIVDECPEDLIVPTQKEDEVGIINTVNTEKLQYRAYSALQQALKRIETLESEVATLKAA